MWIDNTVPINREGTNSYVHIIRDVGVDPDETMPRGGGKRDPNGWRDTNKKSPEYWAEQIAKHLEDAVPRTFNRIALELVGRTADAVFQSNMDKGLWLALEQGRLECTTIAPILWRRR